MNHVDTLHSELPLLCCVYDQIHILTSTLLVEKFTVAVAIMRCTCEYLYCQNENKGNLQ